MTKYRELQMVDPEEKEVEQPETPAEGEALTGTAE